MKCYTFILPNDKFKNLNCKVFAIFTMQRTRSIVPLTRNLRIFAGVPFENWESFSMSRDNYNFHVELISRKRRAEDCNKQKVLDTNTATLDKHIIN